MNLVVHCEPELNRRPTVLENYREVQERYEFQMGAERGRLATALDILTDALALVGQHGVYCRSTREPQYPAMDVRRVMEQIEDSKDLISSVMEDLRKK